MIILNKLSMVNLCILGMMSTGHMMGRSYHVVGFLPCGLVHKFNRFTKPHNTDILSIGLVQVHLVLSSLDKSRSKAISMTTGVAFWVAQYYTTPRGWDCHLRMAPYFTIRG